MKRLLVVEDDSFLNKMLSYNLTADGYEVISVLTARAARKALGSKEFDLVLLDINLPDGNGYDLCGMIKPKYPDTIVIFLTANDQESDQIRGYEVGAVDYITKPFVIGALQRKIKAMFAMLEHHKPARDIYDDGRLFLDFSEQAAALNGKTLALSPMEYKMLNLFRKNPRQVLTRRQLLEKLWDVDEKFVDEHTLTTTISRIRNRSRRRYSLYQDSLWHGLSMDRRRSKMKPYTFSVKKLFGWICIGLLLSMTGITLILFVATLEITVLIVGALLIACALVWFFVLTQAFGKQLSQFTFELCKTLDNMIDGAEEPSQTVNSETLFARINHRLSRLYQIMQENRRKVDEERQELQTLVSDISHQVKTPVSNLKMATDTLLTRPVTETERIDFIKGVRSQTDKLEFLFQALVKTSRLEGWVPPR